MNQTILTNYDLTKMTNLRMNNDFNKNSSNSQKYFISNIQNANQNLQNLQQTLLKTVPQPNIQLPIDIPSCELKVQTSINRNFNANQKSMISSEAHTHFKKQKIQNFKNEEDCLFSASSSSTNQLHSLNNATHNDLGVFNHITQQEFGRTINKRQLNNKLVYSESISSESSSNQCSPEPDDQLEYQFPINLIKSNQDTSSSSSIEMKDNIHFIKDSEPNNSTSISPLYNSLILPVNQKFQIQSTNNDLSTKNHPDVDNIQLVFTKQPAKYHRARYMTEGSRGPIRDKSGKSFPTIKLKGYNNRPVKAYCYLIDAIQINQPHLFYQASKLTSRCLTNCVEIKFGNTIALEFELHPCNNDMELMIDCLGIVKQRLFEIQQQHNQEKSHFKTPYCRLAFECYIAEYNHIVKTWSDTIHCKQMMRAPEIHRMSIKECHASGDKELFIIGKNFTKDIKLYFSYGNQWQEQVTPVKELFHQAHIVCNVPKIDIQLINNLGKTCADKDGQTLKRLMVELYAVCDNKMSSKEKFTYYL